jgi:small ligand-binding sensory domain FIST
MLFPYAHATHPRWDVAVALVLAQLRGQMAGTGYAKNPTLGLLYLTDIYVSDAQSILDALSAELPGVVDWSGTMGMGVCANNVEYFNEPGMAIMLLNLPTDQYRVFSGVAPLGLGFAPYSALVHADGATYDLGELVQEMAGRTSAAYLFGGLGAARSFNVQFARSGDGNIKGHGAATGVFRGGLSGVAFASGVRMLSRITQGCQPQSGMHRITKAQKNMVLTLDDEPALDVMLRDLGITMDNPQAALEVLRATLLGIVKQESVARDAVSYVGSFGNAVTVRHMVGLDLANGAIAVADTVEVGMELAFCQRNVAAARADLMRICSEIREELEPNEPGQNATGQSEAGLRETGHIAGGHIAGAIYVSCIGRGGAHFGSPSAELEIVRHALGDVPLVGFFADGEIAYDRLYSYTGVLTVFIAP